MANNNDVEQLKNIHSDLKHTVTHVKEYMRKNDVCVEKEKHEILPLVVRLSQGVSKPLEKVIRESNADALASLGRSLTELLVSLSQVSDLSNGQKNLIENGYSIMEEQFRNHLNKIAVILENFTNTYVQRFATTVKFYVANMTELKSTWLSTKTTTKDCCFKKIPVRDNAFWLSMLGYFYTPKLENYYLWPELNGDQKDILQMLLQCAALYREAVDLVNIDKQIQEAESLVIGLDAISTETQKEWIRSKVTNLTDIKAAYEHPNLAPADKKLMLRMSIELPCMIKGEEKVPMLYCNEHVTTLMDEIAMYPGSEVGVRVCTAHLNEIKRSGYIANRFECVEKKSLTFDEPVYYLRVSTTSM